MIWEAFNPLFATTTSAASFDDLAVADGHFVSVLNDAGNIVGGPWELLYDAFLKEDDRSLQVVVARLIPMNGDENDPGELRVFELCADMCMESVWGEIGYQVEDEDLHVADIVPGNCIEAASDVFISRLESEKADPVLALA